MLVFLVTACLLAPFFLPNSNLPLLPQRYMQFQYRPWCSSFKGIRALTELLIRNFYWRSSHFSAFEIPNYNPQKVHAIPVAITSCFFVFFPPFQPRNLPTFPNFPISPFSHLSPTFPKFPTSPHSHLSQMSNLTTLLPFPTSQTHHPSIYKLKNSKITTLGLLSPHWFLREGSQYQNWRAKSLFSPPGKRSKTTGFEHWFTIHCTTKICSMWVT